MKKYINQAVTSILAMAALSFTACSNLPDKQLKGNVCITTADKTKLLEVSVIKPAVASQSTPVITIDTTVTYQEMDGFGFTLTGGSAMHISRMDEPHQQKLLQELFGLSKNDIGISYLRLSIGASDLNEAPYSYNDLPKGETDTALERFSLAEDTLYVIPILQKILKINPDIKLMGSPWSPPAWMKTNEDTRGGELKSEYYQVYADYFVKYINAYAAHGITIDAVTIQNEPLNPKNNPSLVMEAEPQAVFIKNHLGPTFEKENIRTKIVLYDHNADRPDYPITILNDPEAAKYVDGSAFHLYGGTIGALSQVHEAYPDKHLYFTEQWISAPGDFPNDLAWHTEQLMIGAPRNWCKNVLEWNIAANSQHKPFTDRGGCDRCLGTVTIDGNTVVRNPAYYIVAQVSKFVRPGSVRIASNMTDSFPNVAYKTPEGTIVVLVFNKSGKDETVTLRKGDKDVTVSLPLGAVGTYTLTSK